MKTAAPISFAGSHLAETRHVCAFFNSEEEEHRVLLPLVPAWPPLFRCPLDNREEERMCFFVLTLRLDTKVLPIPSFNCFLPVPQA
jgi:hypothetical protein